MYVCMYVLTKIISKCFALLPLVRVNNALESNCFYKVPSDRQTSVFDGNWYNFDESQKNFVKPREKTVFVSSLFWMQAEGLALNAYLMYLTQFFWNITNIIKGSLLTYIYLNRIQSIRCLWGMALFRRHTANQLGLQSTRKIIIINSGFTVKIVCLGVI